MPYTTRLEYLLSKMVAISFIVSKHLCFLFSKYRKLETNREASKNIITVLVEENLATSTKKDWNKRSTIDIAGLKHTENLLCLLLSEHLLHAKCESRLFDPHNGLWYSLQYWVIKKHGKTFVSYADKENNDSCIGLIVLVVLHNFPLYF